MDRLALLRRLAEVLGARRYLEIGVWEGRTFAGLADLIPDRVGVDPDPRARATVRQTSDEYFAALVEGPCEPFDLVFVDGLHERRQVVRDVRNAIEVSAPHGVVVVHDCNPPDERSVRVPTSDDERRSFQTSLWCGDVWRGWLDLRVDLERPLLVYGPDLGCGLVLPPGTLEVQRLEAGENGDLSWSAFVSARERLLPIASAEDLEEVFRALRR